MDGWTGFDSGDNTGMYFTLPPHPTTEQFPLQNTSFPHLIPLQAGDSRYHHWIVHEKRFLCSKAQVAKGTLKSRVLFSEIYNV